MLDWLGEHRTAVLFWLFALSLASLVFTALLLPFIVVRLPADYFAGNPRRRPRVPRTALNIAWHIGKNVLGVLFVVAGIAMLVLPGQGLLTILVGVLALDFPGKYRLERWLVSRRGILKTVNRIRARFGKEPLRTDPEAAHAVEG